MSKTSKRLLTLVILTALVALAIGIFVRMRTALAEERAKEQQLAATTQPRVSRDAQGRTLITLTAAQQAKSGLQVEPLASRSVQAEVVAYGTLQEDPSQSFTLRAPVAGILRAAVEHGWPSLGDEVADRFHVAAIEPRFTPTEHVDLASKLVAAQADVQATTSSLAAARAEYERAQKLNAQDKNVSDRVVQEAKAKLEAEDAKLKAAQQTVQLTDSALTASTRPSGAMALTVERGGQVIEVPVQTGEAVEAGQMLLRVGRFDGLLAAVSLPLGQAVDPSLTTARVSVVGRANRAPKVKKITLASDVDAKTLGQSLILRLDASGLGLRPGMPVTVSLTTATKPQEGVIVPSGAVVWYGGKGWAFVQTEPGKFARREVIAQHPTDDGWFVLTGFSPGEQVVVRGGQLLLSEEFKPALPPGGDND